MRKRFSREETLGLYLTVGFLVCAVLVSIFGVLADEVFEIREPGPLDRWATLRVRAFQNPRSDAVALAVTTLGDARFLVPACLATVLVLYHQKHRVAGLLFAGSVIGGWLLETLLKISFHRSRPDLWPALVAERTPSFPSGHATMSTVFFGGIAALVFHLSKSRWLRAASVTGAAAVILAVGASRIFLGAHWLTDVVAGFLVGLFWVVICATGTEYFAKRRTRRSGV
ncbi:MAG TPA: phosphatase PAP2 family protein [Thermoanaerobaculia bacterium]